MDRRALTLAAWRAGVLARRVPLAAALGTACLLGAAALWAKALQLDAQRDAVFADARTVARAAQPAASAPQELAQALELFYATLPESSDAAVAVRQLFDVAQKHSLVLERGEYRVVRDAQARVARYQMILPVKGNPRDVQAFIVDALNGTRLLTLDAVSFRRERPGAVEIESRVQFSLVGRLE